MAALFNNFISLFMESAPWLLLGLLIAGIMKWLVPMDLLKRHMGKDDFKSITKAAVIGAPLPLCSCGVIPAAIGLRRSGASKPSTVSFLIATPETGVDSISVSYALLGPFMAIIRPFSAIFTAIYTGVLVKIFANEAHNEGNVEKNDSNIEHACCAAKQAESKTQDDLESSMAHLTHQHAEVKKCCNKQKDHSVYHAESINWRERIVGILSFSSGKLLKDITTWLLIGLSLAAVIKTYVATGFLTQWGDGLLAMLVMAVIGVPMYICATASTPIAAGFLAVGISPGAVLVFMLAGPATNLSTMGMVRKEMGTSVLVGYIVGILSASIGLGYLANWLVASFQFEVFQVAASHHEMTHSWIYPASALLLSLLIIRNWIKSFVK